MSANKMVFIRSLSLLSLLLTTLVSAEPELRHKKRACHRRRLNATSSASGSSIDGSATAGVALAANPKQYGSNTASFASSTSTASSSKSTSTSNSTTSSSSSTSGKSWGLSGMNLNGIHFGILPDDGSGGGSAQTLLQLNQALGTSNIPAQGWYAQASCGQTFDGSQLLSRKDAIVAAGGVFQPAVMPTGCWKGFTYSDNSQAVAIAKVMKVFTDAGMPVWLRFAHEVNWYQSDGTYSGGVSDFKQGWDVVAKAMRSIAPDVKMWYTPNVASLDVYDQYFPDDVSTVDLIGVDYYPHDANNLDFVSQMQGFHDKYTSDKIKFAMGETGLMVNAGLSGQLQWAQHIMSAEVASAMPNYIAMSWFNYNKEQDFRIIGKDGDWATKAWLAGK